MKYKKKNENEKINDRGAQTIIGKLSGKKITIPNVNVPPMPSLAPPGVIYNGTKAENFGEIDSSIGYPDVNVYTFCTYMFVAHGKQSTLLLVSKPFTLQWKNLKKFSNR